MPEKEFELYLSLLVKLLRLSPEQKTSIERELRDHFEERFESLVRRGVNREAAIRQTLDEFGDVAGLANQFTSLSRRHIRRRIMQGTMATAGIAAAIVIWATLFRGPEPAVGPGPNVVAQENAESGNAAVAASEAPAVTEGDVEWIDPGRFLSEKLAEKTDVQFTGTPLREVMEYLANVHNLGILMDTAALEREGITGDEEVSIDMQSTPLHAVLDTILRKINDVPLAWMPKSEVLLITTRDRADDTSSTRYYNVRDLVAAGYPQSEVMDVAFNTTEGPWEEIDGIGGTMAEFGDLLVVKQCERTQVDVACTLAGLRSTHREARIGELEQHARLFAALDQPIQAQFTGTPLREVIEFIGEIHKVPFFVDTLALNEEGITGDEEVSIDVNGIKLRSVLNLLLERVNDVPLDIAIRDGAIWVTTKDDADNNLGTVIYNVSDITEKDELLLEQLVEVVIGQTEGPWESIDGIGGVIEGLSPGRLACRQSLHAQDEVRAVLAAVRASLEASGGDRSALAQISTKLETRFYRMDAEAAEDVARLIPSVIEPGTWKLVPDSSLMPGTEPDPLQIGTIHRLSAGRMLLRLDNGTVLESTEKNAQGTGGAVPVTPPETSGGTSQDTAPGVGNSNVVVIPQAVLIITHKPAVLRQISKLLQTLLSGNNGLYGFGGNSGRNGFGAAAYNVKFITPGFQEGNWTGSLGGPGGPLPGTSGGGFFSITDDR